MQDKTAGIQITSSGAATDTEAKTGSDVLYILHIDRSMYLFVPKKPLPPGERLFLQVLRNTNDLIFFFFKLTQIKACLTAGPENGDMQALELFSAV